MKNEKKLKPGEITELIFESIANQLIEAGGYIKPRLNVIVGLLIKTIIEKRRIARKKIERALKTLEKRKIIFFEEKENKILVQLNEKGKPIILKYSIKSLINFKKRNKKWNGKWFMVFFDVPEIQRNKRECLRLFLFKLGFYPYQKSVYLFPYECEKEINLVKKIVEGAKYIKFIIAEKIEDQEQAKIFFNLH